MKLFKEICFCIIIIIMEWVCSFFVLGRFDIAVNINIMSILCNSIFISTVFFWYASKERDTSKIYLFISSALVGVGITSLVFRVTNGSVSDISEMFANYSKMYMVSNIYEVLAFVLAFIYVDKHLGIIKNTIISIILLCANIYFSLWCKWDIIQKCKVVTMNKEKAIFEIVATLLLILLLYLVYKRKNMLTDSIYKSFMIFIVARISMNLVTFILIPLPLLPRAILIYMFRLVADFTMIKIALVDMIIKPISIIFKENNEYGKNLEKNLEDLRRANINIERTADKYICLMNSFPDGVIIFNEFFISGANTAFLNMFNIDSEDEVKGKKFEDFAVIRDKVKYENFIISLKQSVGTLSEECYFKYNNVEFYGEVRALKVKGFEGGEYICIIRDITERKELERMEDLLIEKRKEAEIKNDILANISHEFKTPVNVIYSAIQMEELKKDTKDIDQLIKYNGIIKQNCYRLIRLINNFIDITRFNNGGIVVNKEVCNIVDLVENTTMSVLTFAESLNIELVFDTNEEEIYADIDVSMFERVILNLLSNAIKYSKGDVKGHILVTVYGTLDQISLIIKDDGVGIPKEKKELIFSRFERIDKSLSRTNEGSGLGLNIVKEIVDLHNGEIDLESEEGEGTTISIIINREVNEEKIKECIEKNITTETSESTVNLEMSDIYS